MKSLKNIVLAFGVFLVICTLLSTVYAILLNFNITSPHIDSVKVATLIIGIISYFSLGLVGGLTSRLKGFIIGFIYGLIALTLMYLLSLANIINFNITNYLKLIIYFLSTLLGAVFGKNIQKKRQSND